MFSPIINHSWYPMNILGKWDKLFKWLCEILQSDKDWAVSSNKQAQYILQNTLEQLFYLISYLPYFTLTKKSLNPYRLTMCDLFWRFTKIFVIFGLGTVFHTYFVMLWRLYYNITVYRLISTFLLHLLYFATESCLIARVISLNYLLDIQFIAQKLHMLTKFTILIFV